MVACVIPNRGASGWKIRGRVDGEGVLGRRDWLRC